MKFSIVTLCCLMALAQADIHLRTGRIDVSQAERVPAFDPNVHVLSAEGPHSGAEGDKSLYLLSFGVPITEQTKGSVSDVVGHELTEYLPDNAFLIYTSAARASKAAQLPGVTFVGPYHSVHKVAPEVQGASKNLIVNLAADSTRTLDHTSALANRYRRSIAGILPEATVSATSARTLLVSLPAQATSAQVLDVARLVSQQPAVAWIENQPQYRVFDEANSIGFRKRQFF
eukprot:TRINITY_DN894_c0_g1_i5.p1 TRINITY_DN894_c0_g1~~TRINITY_DN894_c0_g1_i5.p1  ORF type:complete len:249 (+),score=69.12 TRINITY_DN894_c0_g1_i5:58-747(+)